MLSDDHRTIILEALEESDRVSQGDYIDIENALDSEGCHIGDIEAFFEDPFIPDFDKQEAINKISLWILKNKSK